MIVGFMPSHRSKKKERDGKDVVGNIIKVKMFKSRLSKENKEVECLLNYDTGLDRYYGMVELAVSSGVWNASANRVETDQGQKVYPKAILKEPEPLDRLPEIHTPPLLSIFIISAEEVEKIIQFTL